MIISGANGIQNVKNEVNDLNVFPVPDGDTGTNMSLTMCAAKKELENVEFLSCQDVAAKASGALLRGARGNSGVILSLLFRGIAKGISKEDITSGKEFAKALTLGVEAAYRAVMKPTEGTILTVAKESAKEGEKIAQDDEDIKVVFKKVIEQAEETLLKTPDMLPVLKKAGVVDAGGKGLIAIYQGMYQTLISGVVVEGVSQEEQKNESSVFGTINTEDIKFAYCTEFIVMKKPKVTSDKLKNYLETIGDSLVIVEDDEIIKVHVHTNHPGNAIEKALSFGELANMKIDNMKLQHTSILENEAQGGSFNSGKKDEKVENISFDEDEELNDFGFVSISCGEGFSEMFSQLGIDKTVMGGQTMNPSTDDILGAIEKTPARTVYVFPNNKNIIMAAQQCVGLCDKQIFVVPTKTLPQGISAFLAFDTTKSAQENFDAMCDAISLVKTAQITFAVRDSGFDGNDIKEGQILALLENKVLGSYDEMYGAIEAVCEKMVDEQSSLMTVYYGQETEEEDVRQMEESLREKYRDIEISLVFGGQPIYYYIISVE